MTPTVAAVARDLACIQAMQHTLDGWGLHRMALAIRRTPDGFSRELKAEHAATQRGAIAAQAALQMLLPREAANDTQHAPDAA